MTLSVLKCPTPSYNVLKCPTPCGAGRRAEGAHPGRRALRRAGGLGALHILGLYDFRVLGFMVLPGTSSQHGLSSTKMALITSEHGIMSSFRVQGAPVHSTGPPSALPVSRWWWSRHFQWRRTRELVVGVATSSSHLLQHPICSSSHLLQQHRAEPIWCIA